MYALQIHTFLLLHIKELPIFSLIQTDGTRELLQMRGQMAFGRLR